MHDTKILWCGKLEALIFIGSKVITAALRAPRPDNIRGHIYDRYPRINSRAPCLEMIVVPCLIHEARVDAYKIVIGSRASAKIIIVCRLVIPDNIISDNIPRPALDVNSSRASRVAGHRIVVDANVIRQSSTADSDTTSITPTSVIIDDVVVDETI